MTKLAIAGTAGAAAGLMFLLDPDRGKRRRALIRDKMVAAGHTVQEAAEMTARDARNRAQGAVAECKSMWRPQVPSNRRLVERVRAKLGHVVGHPSAIAIEAKDGQVTLRGPILNHEVAGALSAVRSVHGVEDVIDELEAHETPEGISALQGTPREDRRSRIWNGPMTPTTRLLLGTAGTALALYGVTRLGR